MCTSFGDTSASLCDVLASVTCYLSTIIVVSAVLLSFVACRLILLEIISIRICTGIQESIPTCPGVCLIGIEYVPC